MPVVRKQGTLLRADADGCLVSDASTRKIMPPWRATVDHTVGTYVRHFGDRVHSIYVRGSVPRGFAIEGVSDVDTFAVLDGSRDDDERTRFAAHREQETSDFLARFPFASGWERVLDWLDDVRSPKREWRRFLLKISAVCVHGEDLGDSIAPVTVGHLGRVVLARGALLGDRLQLLREWIARHPQSVESYCRWMAKDLLRYGMMLVAERDRAFTRDLYYCYEAFSRHYPGREHEMRQVLEWAINPTDSLAEARRLAQHLGGWMAAEFAAQIRAHE